MTAAAEGERCGSDVVEGFLLDDFEGEREEAADDLVAVLQLQTHVEGLDVGQVLQQVEVALEGRVLGVLQTSQLLYQEHEDSLKRK